MIGYDMIGSFPALCQRYYHNLLSYKTKQVVGCYFWNNMLLSTVKSQLVHYLKRYVVGITIESRQ